MTSAYDDDDDDEGFGLAAYREIQAELGQWGEESVTTPRGYSPGRSPGYDHDDYDDSPAKSTAATPPSGGRTGGGGGEDDDDDAMEEGEDSTSPGGRGPAGVQTPEPPRGHVATTAGEDATADEFAEAAEPLVGDGSDSYRLYHDALRTYLRGRDRPQPAAAARDVDVSMMSIDGDDSAADITAAPDEAEATFLASLASICLSRGPTAAGSACGDDAWGEASENEGNFWDLLSALRACGLPSLFYCVDGEDVPELQLAGDPSAMVAISPAEVLDACLGGEERTASLPLRRLTAALNWIRACHARRFQDVLDKDCEGGEDPLLPPPRRRTMWPATLAKLKQQRNPARAFHPDAPLQSAFDNGASSPVNVSSFLAPRDEEDDARLLRACFMLFQSGRAAEAARLVEDCGQPWRAASWIGGEPLDGEGNGNPTRALWKRNCRKVSKRMAQLANTEASSMLDAAGTRALYPSLAYEAAILALLADDADAALRNPAFGTWEDGVHAILRAEVGIVEDDVLRAHNQARAEACEAGGGYFPYPGTELNAKEEGDAPQGHDGDLGAALQKLETSPVARVREGGGDPFRNGAASFLAGRDAPREYVEECAALALESEAGDDAACFLRFVAHLVLYADAVFPDLCARLALPSGMDAATDGVYSLKELLVLKYVAYLSSRRELWPHVAFYTSLLSPDDVVDTYSSFLIRVHGDRERRTMLEQARDLFPKGLDLPILRNVVRGMVMCDKDNYAREAGEEAPPAGVAPADARMMRSVRWLCYHPEHGPDALVCANMLLRRFLLASAGENADAPDPNLHAPKVFVEKILPRDLIDMALEHCQREDDEEADADAVSLPMTRNLEAEFLSIDAYLKAHTKYVQFLDAIAKTSPCHGARRPAAGERSGLEAGIADKMERNAFRQKKMGLCKIVVEFATRASDALMGVLTFGGGWLVDVSSDLTEEELGSAEAVARSEELAAIRSAFVPKAVFMLEEVLDKTAAWLEQVAYDTLSQFEGAAEEMLLALFGSFDEKYHPDEEATAEVLHTSRAAPGHWRKRALSLASVVANDGNGLHEMFDNGEMEAFLKLMAEHAYKLNRCTNSRTFFDY